MRNSLGALTLLVVGLLAGCGAKGAGSPQLSASPPKPAAVVASAEPRTTLQEVMQAEVAPSASVLWSSTGSVTNATGTHDASPQTDADWERVRVSVQTLISAADTLANNPPAQVVHAGSKIQDEGQEGNLTADQILAKMKSQRGAFIRHAKGLRSAADEALKVVDRKNVEQLIEVGGKVDEACEACHVQFWYPDAAE